MNKTKRRYDSPNVTSFVVVEIEQDLLTGTGDYGTNGSAGGVMSTNNYGEQDGDLF